jgi:hypothetical protein
LWVGVDLSTLRNEIAPGVKARRFINKGNMKNNTLLKNPINRYSQHYEEMDLIPDGNWVMYKDVEKRLVAYFQEAPFFLKKKNAVRSVEYILTGE